MASVSLGTARKLLDGIASLRAAKAPPEAAATIATAKDTGERRQLTVMFSDLVGSTALSARMDPEDMWEVISAYQKCVAEAIRRFGGFVAKYMGEGVLVYAGRSYASDEGHRVILIIVTVRRRRVVEHQRRRSGMRLAGMIGDAGEHVGGANSF